MNQVSSDKTVWLRKKKIKSTKTYFTLKDIECSQFKAYNKEVTSHHFDFNTMKDGRRRTDKNVLRVSCDRF